MITAAWPFALQGLVLLVDEFWCHHRRGLGRWERRGHPVDTATFVIAISALLWLEPSTTTLWIYAGLATLSCAVITKDEWEHGRACGGFENWLHAWLFMLHPTTLIYAGWLWWSNAAFARTTLLTTAFAAATFGLYQMLYWTWRGAR